MSGIVLGKRSRGTSAGSCNRSRTATDWPSDESVLKRSKRRLVIQDANSENENPFIVRKNGDEIQVDDKDGTHTVPAKHGPPEKRIAISPAKISDHFKVSKPAIDVYHRLDYSAELA